MKPIEIIVIENDESIRQSICTYFNDNKSIEITGVFSDIIRGYHAITEKAPNIVLIDISENTEMALELVNKISLNHRSSLIFVTSKDSSKELMMRAMRAGAREFLSKPLDLEVLESAIDKSRINIYALDEDSDDCKIFTVFSNKGGIGKTSVATNLAINLADMTGKKVAIVDLNLQLGDVTTFLDITPKFDISYVAENLNRIDEAFLLSTLEQYKDKNIYVLADPPYLEQAEEITPEQISIVLNVMKSIFSYVIVDTSSIFDGKTLSALDASDSILLVSMVNLPSIRNTQRCLDLFNRIGYSEDKIKLVLNRYMPDDEIGTEDVADVLNHEVYWKIPNNYFHMMASINKGIPISILNPQCNVAQSHRELAAILSNTLLINEDAEEKEHKSGFLHHLDFLFNKKTKK